MPQLVYVTNIQKFCTHDGPGIRTSVFFKGCPLKCKWCANPEAIDTFPQLLLYKNKCNACGACIDACPRHAITLENGSIIQKTNSCMNCGECTMVCPPKARKIVGRQYSPEELFNMVNQDKVFYQQSRGGVTFSGGEPLMHPEYVSRIAQLCKEEGYNVAVETCGMFQIKKVKKIIHLIDYLLFDIKIINDEKHIMYCGESNEIIHHNFENLLDYVKIIPRVPIIPSINDTPADIALLCGFFSKYKGKIEKIHILPYHNLAMGKYEALKKEYELKEIKPPDSVHMSEIKSTLEKIGFEVKIGG